jgi:hypothetical protein
MKILENIYQTRIVYPVIAEINVSEQRHEDFVHLEPELFANTHTAQKYLDSSHYDEFSKKSYELEKYYEEDIHCNVEKRDDLEVEKSYHAMSVNSMPEKYIESFLKDNPEYELKTSTITIDDKSFEKKVFVEKTPIEKELDSINEIMSTGDVAEVYSYKDNYATTHKIIK